MPLIGDSMAGLLERIEQEITALKQKTAGLAGEMHDAYHNYLTVLGVAVRRQLVLATYQVCTQSYPNEFLDLPYLQRQQLQFMLRQLAQQVQTDLLTQFKSPFPAAPLAAGLISATPLSDSSLADPSVMDCDTRDPSSATLLPTPEMVESMLPADLLRWQKGLEEMITLELQIVSHAVNRLLQQFDILPKQIPEFLLETAAKANLAEVGDGPPNLLRLMIEAVNASEVEGAAANESDEEGEEDEDEEDEERGEKEEEERQSRSVMQLVTLHLRVAEIEFADPTVSAARSRIRSLQAHLKSLVQKHQKKQRERAIAQAQAAWRSTWAD
ncbi:MAG: hypothetical protein ACKO24_07215 [Leptolyngbyaceae cyanobacterium]